jgi:NAD(P)-dependent dehydrogenase (short-subunit alcohol dehydrogenase family)
MTAAELFDLSGKVAVITGGAGGIGVVYARALCEAGASVLIADLDAGAARRTADDLAAKGHATAGTGATFARRSRPRRWRTLPLMPSEASTFWSTTRRS